jgi:hypothetical protein
MELGFGVEVTTAGGRVAVVGFAGAVLVACLIGSARFYGRSFFHGFMAATGMFLSFDIVVLHWIFGLHRITSGPEADIIEPVLVLTGLIFAAYGLLRERRQASLAR